VKKIRILRRTARSGNECVTSRKNPRKKDSVIAGNTFRRHFLLLPFPQSGPIRTWSRQRQVTRHAFYILFPQAINFDSPRGGISLVTEKGPVTSSRLLIQKAIDRDSGLYTCSPNNTHPNSVRVHIVNGKRKMPISFKTSFTCKYPHVTHLNSNEIFFKRTNSLEEKIFERIYFVQHAL